MSGGGWYPDFIGYTTKKTYFWLISSLSKKDKYIQMETFFFYRKSVYFMRSGVTERGKVRIFFLSPIDDFPRDKLIRKQYCGSFDVQCTYIYNCINHSFPYSFYNIFSFDSEGRALWRREGPSPLPKLHRSKTVYYYRTVRPDSAPFPLVTLETKINTPSEYDPLIIYL